MLRPRVGRRLVRTAVVGGAAYAAGSHMANKSAAQQQAEAEQNAQIADLQQQQAAMAQPQQMAPAPAPQQQWTQPMAAPEPQAAAPVRDPIEALKQLGELKAAGVLTDQEFDAKKAELLKQV